MVIGLIANPQGDSDLGDAATRAAFREGALSGAQSIHYGVAWDIWEPAEAAYSLNGLQKMLDETGDRRVSITISIIDYDGSRKTPSYLDALALDHATVKASLNNLITAIHARAGSRAWVLFLGQEVSNYLASNPTAITPYANLITSAKNHARGLTGWGSIEVSCSLPIGDVADYADYSAVTAACTTEAWTYYFKNGDYSFRDTNISTIGQTFGEDLLPIFTANSTKPIILAEVGCSSAGSGATEELQAAWMRIAIPVFQAYGALIIGANFNWMNEFSSDLLDLLGFTGDLRDWVGGLGMRRVDGTHKAYWDAWIGQMRPPKFLLLGAG